MVKAVKFNKISISELKYHTENVSKEGYNAAHKVFVSVIENV